MITTREINVNLEKGHKLERATTKNIDASIKVELPKEPIKTQSISTTTLADIADIAEKKRRDEIMAERKVIAKIVKPTKKALDAMKKLGMKEKMAKVRKAKRKKK